jgi:hypothetical protein
MYLKMLFKFFKSIWFRLTLDYKFRKKLKESNQDDPYLYK